MASQLIVIARNNPKSSWMHLLGYLVTPIINEPLKLKGSSIFLNVWIGPTNSVIDGFVLLLTYNTHHNKDIIMCGWMFYHHHHLGFITLGGGGSQAICFSEPCVDGGFIKDGLFIWSSWVIGTLLLDKMEFWGIFQDPRSKHNLHRKFIL